MIVGRTVHASLYPGFFHKFPFAFAVIVTGVRNVGLRYIVQASVTAAAAALGRRALIALATLAGERILRVAADVLPGQVRFIDS